MTELHQTRTAVPPDLERRVRADVDDWVDRHQSPWGRAVATASSISRTALAPITTLSPVQRALRTATDRILEQARVHDQVNHDHVQQMQGHRDDPAAMLALASGRSADLRRRRRLVLSAQTAATGAASVTPLTTAVSFVGDLVVVTLGLLHTASGVLATHGVVDADLERLSVGTALLSTERRPAHRRHGLQELVTGPVDPDCSSSEVVAGQAGPRLAADAVESLVRRLAGRRTMAAAPVLGAITSAASTVWMVDAVVDTASQVGAMRLLDLDLSTS